MLVCVMHCNMLYTVCSNLSVLFLSHCVFWAHSWHKRIDWLADYLTDHFIIILSNCGGRWSSFNLLRIAVYKSAFRTPLRQRGRDSHAMKRSGGACVKASTAVAQQWHRSRAARPPAGGRSGRSRSSARVVTLKIADRQRRSDAGTGTSTEVSG